MGASRFFMCKTGMSLLCGKDKTASLCSGAHVSMCVCVQKRFE